MCYLKMTLGPFKRGKIRRVFHQARAEYKVFGQLQNTEPYFKVLNRSGSVAP